MSCPLFLGYTALVRTRIRHLHCLRLKVTLQLARLSASGYDIQRQPQGLICFLHSSTMDSDRKWSFTKTYKLRSVDSSALYYEDMRRWSRYLSICVYPSEKNLSYKLGKVIKWTLGGDRGFLRTMDTCFRIEDGRCS